MTIVPIDPKIRLLVEQTKNSGGVRKLTRGEINLRLHLFNLVFDHELFNDVHSDQAYLVMYPEVSDHPHTTDRRYVLATMFGDLPEPKES